MAMTASPLATLSEKLMAPYTKAPLCWDTRAGAQHPRPGPQPPPPPAAPPHRVGADEVGRHGQRGDEDGGTAHAQQRGRRVHGHAQPVRQRHPGGEGQDRQEPRKVGQLRGQRGGRQSRRSACSSAGRHGEGVRLDCPAVPSLGSRGTRRPGH